MCSDARVFWTFRRIAGALGISESHVNMILRRWRQRGFQIRDMRHHRQQFRQKKMTAEQLRRLTSPFELNRMRSMSLRERADEVRRSRRYRVQLTHTTLYRYYRQANVSFKTVDLHAVSKLMNARRILRSQRDYCHRIQRLQASKAVFFLDETTTSLRKKCKTRTWTNGMDVALPYQNNKDHNRSIVGAVGGSVAL